MFFRKPKLVICAVCGNPIAPKDRRFVDKKGVTKVVRHTHIECQKPGQPLRTFIKLRWILWTGLLMAAMWLLGHLPCGPGGQACAY
jgi:hypothetical protein